MSVQVRYFYGEPRKKPREGDRRETKAHGVQYRVQEIARNPATGHPIGYRVSNGRPVYEWRAAAELLGTRYEHYLTAEDRAALVTGGTHG
jgi:hypothetical protein